MSLNHKRVTVPSWCFTWRCLSPEKDEILKQMSICATELFILLILLLGISWQLHRTCDLSRRSRHTFEKRVKMWKNIYKKRRSRWLLLLSIKYYQKCCEMCQIFFSEDSGKSFQHTFSWDTYVPVTISFEKTKTKDKICFRKKLI